LREVNGDTDGNAGPRRRPYHRRMLPVFMRAMAV